MIPLLAASALAGPLNEPDPDDLRPYRCVDRPLGLANDGPLGDRTVSESPPGPPIYPPMLQSGLTPFTTDGVLKKSGRGTGQYPAPAVASLATGGSVVARNCQNRADTVDEFTVGCRARLACTVLTRIEGVSTQLDRRPQAAAKFSPVDSAKEALGLAWFLDDAVFLPLTPNELAAWAEEAPGYRLVEPTVPWVEIEAHEKGWLVRAPRRVSCGCDHDVVRQAYWISKDDGRACAVDEPPVPLALARSEVCVD